jgi:hypothetical protein
MIARGIALLLAVVIIGPGPALAQNFGAPQDAGVRAEVGRVIERKSGSVVTGYVRNDSFYLIDHVKVHVKVLDGSGRVLAEADRTVLGEVPAFGRAPFDVPVRTAGERYEATVVSLERPQIKGGAD